jgi:uncharacterized surface protein with fasciclin (FAS1) repeats
MIAHRSFRTLAAAAGLLLAPAILSAQTPTQEKAPMKTIAEIAVESGNFTTLVTALKAAGLVETLQGPGPFTVFAPTDAAFAKLPDGAVAGLLDDKAQLTSVLTYHVVSGRVMAGDIVKANGATPATVNGQEVDVVVRDGKVFVNGAQVVSADIVASNGVIHVIDGVLMPKAEAAAAR